MDTAIQRIPTLVSLTLAEDQAVIVNYLVEGFVLPNSLYDEDLTKPPASKPAARWPRSSAPSPATRRFSNAGR